MERSPLYHDVKQFIESWEKNLKGNQPTEEQEDELKDFIFNLGTARPMKLPRHAQDGDDHDNLSTKSKTNDDHPDERTTKTSKPPATLMELVRFILESFHDDKRLVELRFNVGTRHVSIYFEGRDQFEGALNKVQHDQLEMVALGDGLYRVESMAKAVTAINALLCTPEDLVRRINELSLTTTSLDQNVLEWDEHFVDVTNKNDEGHIVFCSDFSKGSALVVTGESGSGKTWYSQKYITNKLGGKDVALIYYSIEDHDGQDHIKPEESFKDHKMACGKAMCYLVEAGRGNCDAYQCLSDLSMEYNHVRDKKAYNWLMTHIGMILSSDKVVNSWWNAGDQSKFHPVEKLVLVVDEVGKNPELARGLVSNVRKLYPDIKMGDRAEKVLLVLVGSGLERHIRYDRVLDLGADSEEARATIASFGTDPMKSNIITLKGPNLTREEIHGIPTKSILRGTYSRTLSTNTRMLTRGVLPMMKITQFTDNMPDDQKLARYEVLGSTNVVMDFSARNYVALNGLARMKFDFPKLQRLLLTQFKLLLHASLATNKDSNPASVKILNDLTIKMPRDLDEITALGLVTADVKSTSAALRYLACNGSTAPLDARDGIGFEIMVQHHLVRLYEAYNSNPNDSSQDPATRWVGQCTLTQAWPPHSPKGDVDLSDNSVTQNEVEQNYKCNNGDDDIDAIMDLLEDKKDFDLVMRQTASNAQGADLMVLSRKHGEVVLHLFQCKNWNMIPGVKSKKFVESLWSLEVKVDKEGINAMPGSGSAGYSYLGTQHFAKKLGEELGTEVKIGDRFLVFSLEGTVEGRKALDRDFLQKAMDKGVMVWTKEMLEPTISALYYKKVGGQTRRDARKGKRRNKTAAL